MTELETKLRAIVTALYQNNIIISKLQSDSIYCNVKESCSIDFMPLLKEFKSIISPLKIRYKVIKDDEFNPTSLNVQLELVGEILYPYVMKHK